ncbi:AAA family ATPase [Streptomyces sp. LS1784]|uniref:AAA family ATPase n=1 Tax=Streptomyces sp. LS1784 TaxID=2851533 RepID=UPI001CCA999D|nr:AAA family ATPase [Streptomyces sp. LS1784]
MTTIAPPLVQDDLDDPFARAEPNDLAAEQALVGAVPLARDPRRLLRDLHLTDSDFYRGAHATIYTAYSTLVEAGQPIDPITVANRLQAQGDLIRVGGPGYLHTCIQAAERGANPEWLADHLRALALRRELIRAGRDLIDAAFDPTGGDEAAAELAEQAVTRARTVRDAGRAIQDQPVEDIHDHISHPDEGYDWVLPGLLEHTDRVVWTAGEGGGKSVLQRQLAVTAAAGVLPFGGEPNALGPQRVLVLDCENSARQSRRHYRALMNVAERQRTPVRRGQLHIDLRPEGVDLTRPDGRAWLMRRVEATMPDLLIVGPIYRLHAGDPNSEELARKVTVVLDEARATAGCALSLEAHSPQGGAMGPRALRPVGSSLWLRWPEFGYGLRPVEDERTADEDRGRRVIPWRGARDERQWPVFICQGAEGGWPWRAYRPIDTGVTGYSPTGALS